MRGWIFIGAILSGLWMGLPAAMNALSVTDSMDKHNQQLESMMALKS